MSLSPELLQAFMAVYHQGSITRAAEQLHLTQPAISKRIAALEKQLDIRLFERFGRQLLPTPAAGVLLHTAERWQDEARQLRQQLQHTQEKIAGELNIGVSHYIGLHHLADVLRRFVQRYPAVQLRVSFVDSEAAHALVLQGRLELAFLTLPPQADARLQYQAIWTDALCFAIAPFHPLAAQPGLSLQHLLDYPALLPAIDTYTSQITLQLFRQAGLKPSIQHHTNTLDAIAMLVSVGMGWSVLPRLLLHDNLIALDSGQLPPLSRQLGMVWHGQRQLPAAAAALQQLIS